jgi:hypothetical protein
MSTAAPPRGSRDRSRMLSSTADEMMTITARVVAAGRDDVLRRHRAAQRVVVRQWRGTFAERLDFVTGPSSGGWRE